LKLEEEKILIQEDRHKEMIHELKSSESGACRREEAGATIAAAVVRSFIRRERRGPREREKDWGWLHAPLRVFFFFFLGELAIIHKTI
jgi:hypothetical protein